MISTSEQQEEQRPLDNQPALKLHEQRRSRVPARRKSMRKVKEVLRLRFELG
jgi:hypothetical protein